MKKILFLALATLSLGACQNELYKDPAIEHQSCQGVYIAGNSAIQTFVAENQAYELSDVRLGLVKRASEPIKSKLIYGDANQLAAYNKKNGTEYILLPKEVYEAPEEVTFEALSTSKSVPVKLKPLTFSKEGTYALPIKIDGMSGAAIGGQNEAIIVFEPLTVTKALRLNGSGPRDVLFSEMKVSQWTFEIMVNRQQYTQRNKALGGTKEVSHPQDEIYTRFGDVTIATNQLQIKTGGSQIDIPASALSAKPGEWYMLSFVYDGKTTSVYVNGVLAAEAEIRTGEYGLKGFWLSGANELVREYRFYKVARTPIQIAANVWKTVDPTDENLIVYYPMNGKKYDHATGQVTDDESQIWDWSKNGHHFSMPSNARFDDNKGNLFKFPLVD